MFRVKNKILIVKLFSKGEEIMNQEKIGKFIADKRKERNLTQEQLAEKSGISLNF